MVRYLVLALTVFVSACSLTPESKRPSLVEPEQQIPTLELLEHEKYASFEYPTEVESVIKSAKMVVPDTDRQGNIYYRPATNRDKDQVLILLTAEESFLIRDLFVAARENKNLADRLIRLQELSVDERNQLVRVLKTEAYRMQRTKAFTEYYKAEVDRLETANTIESWAHKILVALALIVAI